MPSRTRLERQLARAEQNLAQRVEQLKAKGAAPDAHPSDPAWRRLDAARNAVQRRLRAVDAVVANDADVANRKSSAGESEA